MKSIVSSYWWTIQLLLVLLGALLVAAPCTIVTLWLLRHVYFAWRYRLTARTDRILSGVANSINDPSQPHEVETDFNDEDPPAQNPADTFSIRGRFWRELIAGARAEFDCRVDSKAQREAVRRFMVRTAQKHGVRASHIANGVHKAVETAFMRSLDDTYARQASTTSYAIGSRVANAVPVLPASVEGWAHASVDYNPGAGALNLAH